MTTDDEALHTYVSENGNWIGFTTVDGHHHVRVTVTGDFGEVGYYHVTNGDQISLKQRIELDQTDLERLANNILKALKQYQERMG